VAVRKRGIVSLGQEDTQQGKVRGRNITTGHTCQSLSERRESERPKEAQLLALKGAKA